MNLIIVDYREIKYRHDAGKFKMFLRQALFISKSCPEKILLSLFYS